MISPFSQQLRRIWQWRSPPAIDLGGGRLVPAEDLLEGHFRRLEAEGRAHYSGAQPVRAQQVSVEVRPALKSVIEVAAPTLAPLAQIAEQVAEKLPTLQPAAGFRDELHRALEEAHRHRDEAPAEAAAGWAALLAAALVGLGVAWLVLRILRRRAT